jgi:hypothetical protein
VENRKRFQAKRREKGKKTLGTNKKEIVGMMKKQDL